MAARGASVFRAVARLCQAIADFNGTEESSLLQFRVGPLFLGSTCSLLAHASAFPIVHRSEAPFAAELSVCISSFMLSTATPTSLSNDLLDITQRLQDKGTVAEQQTCGTSECLHAANVICIESWYQSSWISVWSDLTCHSRFASKIMPQLLQISRIACACPFAS